MSVRLVLHVKGMHCASCVGRVEQALEAVKGVEHAAVNLATEKAVITASSEKLKKQLVDAARKAGYDAELMDKSAGLGALFAAQTRQQWLRFIQFAITAGLAAPVMMISMGFVKVLHGGWVMLALATGALAVGGGGFIWRAVRAALRLESDMDTLVALGSLSAYFFSIAVMFTEHAAQQGTAAGGKGHLYFETAVMIPAFVLLGRWLESLAKGRAARSVKKLVSLMPSKAVLLKDGAEAVIDPGLLVEGDVVLVKPGQKVPADGVVKSGASQVDESAMTGETRPVGKQAGDFVLAGTVNGSGAVEVTVRRAGEQTALWGVVRLVEQAQSSKPPIQRIADRVAAVFVPSILVLALGTFAWWFIATRGGSISEALLPAVAVLLVSCPCALGLATPTAITVGAGLAAEHGILIRDASGLESLYTLDAVVLDKTGTLTHGSHEVTVFKPLAGADGQSTLALAASVESRSEHVLSRAVVRHARKNGAAPADVAEFESIAGMGVRGVTGGRLVVVGNAALMRHLGIQLDGAEDAASELRTTGHTVIFAAVDGKVAALIALADIVREEARPVMAALRRMGLKILMVTGDTRETAISVGRQAGISPQEILSEVRPEDKANVIRHLKKERMKVGMVGDGVNDAPALAEADVGIAMATGTDVAIEAADVTLGRADLNSLLDAIRVSRATMRTIKQNLFWAFVYNMTLIPMAAAGKLHPMYAALAMSLSSVTVVVNSLWIRRVRVSRVTPPGI